MTEAGTVAAAAACLATFGCSLRFGLVLLAVSYSSCKLRQFKETRVVQDYTTISTPLAAKQQQEQEQQQPRDWLEVGGCRRAVRSGCSVEMDLAWCCAVAVQGASIHPFSSQHRVFSLSLNQPRFKLMHGATSGCMTVCMHANAVRTSTFLKTRLLHPPAVLLSRIPQVAGVAAIPTILAIAYGAMAGCLDLPLGSLPNVETWRADLLTLLQGAVLGWYACICGDAWSSELGELSGGHRGQGMVWQLYVCQATCLRCFPVMCTCNDWP